MPSHPSPRDADQVFQREWGAIRSSLLDLAASLDRIDRAEGDVLDPAEKERIERAIAELLDSGEQDRAERIQRLFSREYVREWRKRFAEGQSAAESAAEKSEARC